MSAHTPSDPEPRPDEPQFSLRRAFFSLVRPRRGEQPSAIPEERQTRADEHPFDAAAFQYLLQAAPDAIVIVDGTGAIVLVNRQAEVMFGYEPGELHGRPLAQLIPERFHTAHTKHLEGYNAEPRVRPMGICRDLMAVRKGGGEFPVEVSLSPMPVGAGTATIAIVRDITERKRAEAARLELAREQAARAAAEANQAEVARLNERLQRAMMETHHRVKNNLQTIAAMVDLQLMTDREHVPVDVLRRLGRHVFMLAAVHDILTREARDDAQAHYLSARELLGRLIPMLEGTSVGRPIASELAEMRMTARQGTALAVVVNELVLNAFKHGAGATTITLEQSAGRATLTVDDEGPGFPPHFLAVEQASTGLDLVTNLSRWDLGGEAHFLRAPGGGARVLVSFPLPAQADATTTEP